MQPCAHCFEGVIDYCFYGMMKYVRFNDPSQSLRFIAALPSITSFSFIKMNQNIQIMSQQNDRKRSFQNEENGQTDIKKRNAKATKKSAEGATFNSLPKDIVKEILCNVERDHLVGLKYVCSDWNKMISEILGIHEVKQKDIEIFEWLEYSSHSYSKPSIKIYRAPYKLDQHIISSFTNSNLNRYWEQEGSTTLRSATFKKIADELHTCVWNSACRSGWEFFEENEKSVAWRYLLHALGLEHPIEELVQQGHDGAFAKSLQRKYKWFWRQYLFSKYTGQVGFIAIYPDNRTFVVFDFPLDEQSLYDSSDFKDSDGHESCDHYSCGHGSCHHESSEDDFY